MTSIEAAEVRVDVWIWPLAVSAQERERLRQSLSADECARADRFVFVEDRHSFVVARGHMRRLLGEATGVAPDAVPLIYGPSGKPLLAAGPHFNLSHSGGLAALAICRECNVGIDIEKVRPVERDIAGRFFSACENEALDAVEGDCQMAFFRCWTRKEAVLKALGCGLNRDTRTFSVAIDPGVPGQRLGAAGVEPDPCADRAWALFDLKPGAGFAGAVAIKCGDRNPRIVVET